MDHTWKNHPGASPIPPSSQIWHMGLDFDVWGRSQGVNYLGDEAF